jgi:hypothetical protein
VILVTSPEYELPTRFVSKWASKVVKFAQTKGHSVSELKKEKARRATVESYLIRTRPRLVMFNGHGGPDCIYGQDDEVLIKAGENEQLLANTITYCVACESNLDLGPKAVAAGATAFIGYSRPFVFFADEEFRTRPLDDTRAANFFESSNQVMTSLLKNHTVSESVEHSKESSRKKIQSLLTSNATSDDLLDAQALRWNMIGLGISGDMSAVV